tara:strand:+ start:187 stop:912 length:726 start_codon:yes stop_codon:yes gene_type:complete
MKSLYFPHDSNAHEDMRVIELRMDYGWEAYGLFWALLEVMRIADDYSISDNIKPLAYKFQIKPDKLQAIIDRCLELKLLSKENNMLYCNELNDRMIAVESKSANARKAAEKRWSNANAMQTHSERNAIKVNKSKSKLNKSISNNTNTGSRLFKNDPLYDFINFEKCFLNSKYENADLEFYYESVKNWADSNGTKKKDWGATARNFMLRDLKDNKLKLKNGVKQITDEERELAQWVQDNLSD